MIRENGLTANNTKSILPGRTDARREEVRYYGMGGNKGRTFADADTTIYIAA
ncbi:MAG TPA: hypothetical protein VGU63_07770 [Candidatus Acidoferrales bacterium]|nr:hypothetical protein [Candidatus Acidoferrales bacterium]